MPRIEDSRHVPPHLIYVVLIFVLAKRTPYSLSYTPSLPPSPPLLLPTPCCTEFEPRTSCMLSKCSITDQHAQFQFSLFSTRLFPFKIEIKIFIGKKILTSLVK